MFDCQTFVRHKFKPARIKAIINQVKNYDEIVRSLGYNLNEPFILV